MTESLVPFSGFANPWRVRPLPERSFVSRVRREKRSDVAAVTVENILAEKFPHLLSGAAFADIYADCRLAVVDAVAIHEQLFEHAYRAFAADDRFTDDEVDYLMAVRRELNVGEDVVIRLENSVVIPRIQREIAEATADGVFTAEERASLNVLAAGLRIPEHRRKAMYAAHVGPILNRALTDRLAGHRLSPDEFLSVVNLAKNLGINPTFDDPTTSKLMHRYALLWRIEHGDLPVAETNIPLGKKELCRFSYPAAIWYEQRSQRAALSPIDMGPIYLTDSRVVFNGTKRSFSLKLSTLLGIRTTADMVILEKPTGRHPHMWLSDETEVASVLLKVLMREAVGA